MFSGGLSSSSEYACCSLGIRTVCTYLLSLLSVLVQEGASTYVGRLSFEVFLPTFDCVFLLCTVLCRVSTRGKVFVKILYGNVLYVDA